MENAYYNNFNILKNELGELSYKERKIVDEFEKLFIKRKSALINTINLLNIDEVLIERLDLINSFKEYIKAEYDNYTGECILYEPKTWDYPGHQEWDIPDEEDFKIHVLDEIVDDLMKELNINFSATTKESNVEKEELRKIIENFLRTHCEEQFPAQSEINQHYDI